MKKMAMIGCGKLGLPCAEVMATKYDVVGYDVYKDPNAGIPMMDTIEEAVKDRDLIFIAVPTPHDPRYDGRFPIADLPPKDFDYSIVQQVLRDINPYVNQQQLVALISTVTPGTVREHLEPLLFNARFIYNPYLIAMGSVKWDMVNPECIIIGTEDGTLTGDAKYLIDFYGPLMENNPRINVGTWDEAECIKIFYNTFISAKLALVNMIQDVAEANENINVDVVTDALKAATQRITGPRYMTAGMGDAGACLPTGEIVITSEGPREIQKIRQGELVLARDGKLHPVVQTWHREYSGQITKITVEGQPSARFTSDHKMIVCSDGRSIVPDGRRNTFHAVAEKLSEEMEIKAVSLSVGDFLPSPIPEALSQIEPPSHATPEYCELAGWYLAEGSLEFEENRQGRISFSLNKNERHVADRLAELLLTLSPSKISGRGKGSQVTIKPKGKNGLQVRYGSLALATRLYNDFGKGASAKKLPAWAIYGPQDLSKLFLQGLFQGDGHSSQFGMFYSTISMNLAYGVQIMLNRFGIPTTLRDIAPRISKKGQKHQRSFEVRIRNVVFYEQLSRLTGMNCPQKKEQKLYTRFPKLNDAFYRKVLSVEVEEYTGDVWNLWVDEDHTYTTAIGSVSNCHPRDNIALRAMAERYHLGYDLFQAIMHSRDKQARKIAFRLVRLHDNTGLPIYIHGRAFKPYVSYTIGSYSELIGWYIGSEYGVPFLYIDPLTNDDIQPKEPGIFLMAHNGKVTYEGTGVKASIRDLYCDIPKGSIVLDPWRTFPETEGVQVIHYGNPRKKY